MESPKNVWLALDKPLHTHSEKLWADKGYPDFKYFISPYKSKVTLQQHQSNNAKY
jgi:hypothetical protein